MSEKESAETAQCPSTHGGSGFMFGDYYDPTAGCVVCACGERIPFEKERLPSWIPWVWDND
jgi:hypothetical protein